MYKTYISAIAIALAAASACAFAPNARADVKYVQVTTSSIAARKAAPGRPGSAAMGGRPVVTTISMSGSKVRTDSGQMVAIVDSRAKTMTLLKREDHTYETAPDNRSLFPRRKSDFTIQDTGQTKVILGHKARHFIVKISRPQENSSLNGDLWVAADLPQSPAWDPVSRLQATIPDELKDIKGMPLISSLTIEGGQYGAITIKTVVKSISLKKLPASEFAIPAGYKKTHTPVMSDSPGQD